MDLTFLLIFTWLTAAGTPQASISFFDSEDACHAAGAAHMQEIAPDPVQSNGLWVCLGAPLTVPAKQPKGSI